MSPEGNMKIVCTSDLHGHLPPIPECDLLILAGDICPDYTNDWRQIDWLEATLAPWLDAIPADVIAVAGNHDRAFERIPHAIPDLRWTYLRDQSTTIAGLTVYGVPYILPIWGAFQRTEEQLVQLYERIPPVDILVSHGPPHGIRDRVSSGESVGSYALRDRARDIKPKCVVFGHIHPGYGVYEEDGVRYINAALCNDAVQPVNTPHTLEL
jgi:Icc-related predicted phosphoesterase